MNAPLHTLIIGIAVSWLASAAHAQFSIPWSTTDSGGGSFAGGTFSINGTIAQPDATVSAALTGGTFTITGGFWPVSVPVCLADFNNSGAVSVQDIFDFLAAYFSGDPRADINFSGAISVQDIFDFLALYFAGCP